MRSIIMLFESALSNSSILSHFKESYLYTENFIFVLKLIPTAKPLCLHLLHTAKMKGRNMTVNGKTTKKNTKQFSVSNEAKKLCCEILGYEGKKNINIDHRLIMNYLLHTFIHTDMMCSKHID